MKKRVLISFSLVLLLFPIGCTHLFKAGSVEYKVYTNGRASTPLTLDASTSPDVEIRLESFRQHNNSCFFYPVIVQAVPEILLTWDGCTWLNFHGDSLVIQRGVSQMGRKLHEEDKLFLEYLRSRFGADVNNNSSN